MMMVGRVRSFAVKTRIKMVHRTSSISILIFSFSFDSRLCVCVGIRSVWGVFVFQFFSRFFCKCVVTEITVSQWNETMFINWLSHTSLCIHIGYYPNINRVNTVNFRRWFCERTTFQLFFFLYLFCSHHFNNHRNLFGSIGDGPFFLIRVPAFAARIAIRND